ncbi:MAG TPA: glycoside hydrolase family 3 N-terminal domain-containing protein [Steroidobacteraceae bacterium]|jgi:beta-glucosidase
MPPPSVPFIRALLLALSLCGAWCASANDIANAAPDPQIEALIGRMTLEEKAGQLSIFADEIRSMDPGVNPDTNRRQAGDLLKEIRAGRVGAVLNGVGVAGGRLMQRTALEESRLKIPMLFGGDVIHGFRTVFPIPLGEAASFEPALAERTSRIAAIEATAAGLHWTFAPMVDVARDQRWGRVAEGSGEDVYLGKLFAAARVRGFQGSDLSAPDSLLATPKHFAAYGAVAAGMDYNSVDISEQTLREVHLPPFTAAFDAGALSTMSAFNDINGVPSSANRYLMTDILRGEWGFKGFVVSDYTADEELVPHGYAQDKADAARLAILAGVDMSMQSGLYIAYLPKLVTQGRVPQAVVDESVRRVLRVKKALGLFDNPYRSLDAAREKQDSGTVANRALARESARKSIVLLKNSGDLLPLRKTAKIALIGPFGADRKNLHGPWTLFANDRESVTLADGLSGALQKTGTLTVVKGSEVESPLAGGIAAAVAAAKAADVVLLAIGESERMSGEAESRTEIIVPAPQQALADAVAATGKPIVVLLRNGRALALKGAVRNAQAILVTWFLGSETGNAVADVVFGDYSPAGRLPVSFPQESGQEPYFYNHKNTGRPFQRGSKDPTFKARYREVANEALYPFGYGLSYTKFSYGPLTLSDSTLAWNGSITVQAQIANTGKRAGEEVAQLYIHDRVASLTRPIRELKGIRKVSLEPGRSAQVSFTLSRHDLEFVGHDLKWIAEPGAFDVWIAPSSSQGTPQTFTLAAP